MPPRLSFTVSSTAYTPAGNALELVTVPLPFDPATAPAILLKASKDHAAVAVGELPSVSVNVAVKVKGVFTVFKAPVAGPVIVAEGALFEADAL